ncbi:MAG: class I SAM-dependent methyltransferase [Acidobacteria bacterium]|nr:class I SAM-dependent methyltransferase [Acidobacteriota bacterium]
MTWYREWFGEDYLELYSYRDADEARGQASFVREIFGAVDGTLLDLASGMGRHIDELRRLGYSVTGCDLSYVLLRHGLGKHGDMPVVRADMRSLPFRAESFAGLVNFFTSFGYFDSAEEDADALGEMRRVLRPGAPVLFDYLNVRRELERLVEREEREIDGEHVAIERWFDAASSTFNKRITIGGRRFIERVRGYDLDEMSRLFVGAGFAIRDVYGDFSGAPFSDGSPRLILAGTRQA